MNTPIIKCEPVPGTCIMITFNNPKCSDCNKTLTLEEHHYYEYRCESCEKLWHERIEAWRLGAEDKELDALYNVKEEQL